LGGAKCGKNASKLLNKRHEVLWDCRGVDSPFAR
jgi:hypothetical protein